MPPTWVTMLELIANGEPVDAATPNRPLSQLGQRTDYLKALVDTLNLGGAIIDLNAAVNIDVQEGMPVYWESVRKEYAPALAALDYDNSGIYGSIADSSYVLGTCVSKSGPTRGTVMFGGVVDDLDVSASIDGEIIPGPYFLSATDPGKLVRQRPPVGIHALFVRELIGSSVVAANVIPTPREVLEDHIHYRIPLEYSHTMGDPGWTDVFDVDLAPPGARFSYVITEDEKINDLFPFVPAELVYFEIDGIGANSKVLIDLNGIWWIDPSRDPDEYELMTVYYAKMTAKTDNTIVSSLRPWYENGPLKIVNCYGEDAVTGDLRVKLDLLFSEGAETTPGYLAVKELTEAGQFLRGPVVESIKSVSPEISIRLATDAEGNPEGVTGENGEKQGKLLIEFSPPDGNTRQGQPTLTTLFGAQQADLDGIPYVSMPPENFESSIGYRFDILPSGLSGDYQFTFNCWILATSTGVLPTITATYSILRTPTVDAAENFSSIITGSGQLTLAQANVTAKDYILGSFGPLDVLPGDQVNVTIARDDSSYPGNVGILRESYTMVAVTGS